MVKEDVPDKWDHETDVLIVGAGTARLPVGLGQVDSFIDRIQV